MCGILGVFAPKEDVARLTFFGLLSLQHRGQESVGIATSNGRKIKCVCGLGLVSQVFDEKNIKKLKGKIAIGHTRYSTEGTSDLKNAQPIFLSSIFGSFALAHNGNIANFKKLKKSLLQKGHSFDCESDSEVIAHDTVATIINDLITVGATPLVVHAYWAFGDNQFLKNKKR